MKHFLLSFFSFIALSVSAAAPIVDFVTPSIVRVRWNPEGLATDNATGICTYTPQHVNIQQERRGELTIMKSDSLTVLLGDDGNIIFLAERGGLPVAGLQTYLPKPYSCDTVVRERIVYDESSARMEDTANGKVTVKDVLSRDTIGTSRKFKVSFLTYEDEAMYGLGSHMEDYMNLEGKTLYLTQHNLKAFVPMIVSNGGFGLLFDAGCSMKFESKPIDKPSYDETPTEYETSMELEAANTMDYYFI
ncbi:MAG: hypothetical protein K2G13_04680, partial [Muribaculaceae bacterium]|nr:hypothetical protein [Muribaculaceae bacterium]